VMVFTKGKKFPIKTKEGEGNIFEFIEGIPTFISKFYYPTNKEIRNYTNGNLDFRVLVDEKRSFYIVLIKIGAMIQEIVFNPNLYKHNEVEYYIKNESNMFHIILLNAKNDKLEVLRTIGLNDKLKNRLHKVWADMINKNVDQDEFLEWYRKLARNYKTKELWNRAIQLGRMKKEDY